MAEYSYDLGDGCSVDECGKYLRTGSRECGGLTANQSQKYTTSQAGNSPAVQFGVGGVVSVQGGALVKQDAASAQERHSRLHGPIAGSQGPRVFASGASRDTETGKLDFEGFLSPLVIERYAEYMDSHRAMSDGSIRGSDNWQRGIPLDVYMKSLWRHFFDLWKIHRGVPAKDTLEAVLCAVLFNVMGYLHETLKKKQTDAARK